MVKCDITDCIHNENGTCNDDLVDVHIVWDLHGPTCGNLQYWEEDDKQSDI